MKQIILKQTILSSILLNLILFVHSAGAIPWPLISTSAEHLIYEGYGQFSENTLGSGFHFHEGLDIKASDGDFVISVEDGQIAERVNVIGAEKFPQLLTITRASSSSTAWAYVHMRFAINPATGLEWSVGDNVIVGDTLGFVDQLNSGAIFSHLHFEFVNDNDGIPATGGAGGPALNGDPLEFLSPNNDATKPKVMDIKYRKAVDEGNNSAIYLTQEVNGMKVVFGNVDMVVESHVSRPAYPDPV